MKKQLSRLRKADNVCTIRSGEEGGEECLLPDAESEMICRRAEEIRGKNNQLLIPRVLRLSTRLGLSGEGERTTYEEKVQQQY